VRAGASRYVICCHFSFEPFFMSKLATHLTVIIAILFPVRAFSQVSVPFTLGKDYRRSEITAVIGTPERFSYVEGGEGEDLEIKMYGKGIILSQYYEDLNLEWVPDGDGYSPLIDFRSSKITMRKAPLVGIALTDPTYRILEDKIPGGLYVGMPRASVKSIDGEHKDLGKNHYQIRFDDRTRVLMYYNAWDRISFIEYVTFVSGGTYLPGYDPYTPVDEKDTLLTTFHGPEDLRGIPVPADPADVFSIFSDSNLQENRAGHSSSGRVPLSSLIDFDRQSTDNNEKEKMTYVQAPFRKESWRGLQVVLHDNKDDVDWDGATAIRWYYFQESNRAVIKDRIVALFARKGYEPNQRNYSFLPVTGPTKITIYADLQGNIQEIRINHGGRIYLGRLLKRGEKLQPEEKARYLTIFKDVPQPKFLGIVKRKNKKEIIGTYCLAEPGK